MTSDAFSSGILVFHSPLLHIPLGVGKTCVMSNFIGQSFKTNYTHTVGVEFANRVIDVGEKMVNFHLLDAVLYKCNLNLITIQRLVIGNSSL